MLGLCLHELLTRKIIIRGSKLVYLFFVLFPLLVCAVSAFGIGLKSLQIKEYGEFFNSDCFSVWCSIIL